MSFIILRDALFSHVKNYIKTEDKADLDEIKKKIERLQTLKMLTRITHYIFYNHIIFASFTTYQNLAKAERIALTLLDHLFPLLKPSEQTHFFYHKNLHVIIKNTNSLALWNSILEKINIIPKPIQQTALVIAITKHIPDKNDFLKSFLRFIKKAFFDNQQIIAKKYFAIKNMIHAAMQSAPEKKEESKTEATQIVATTIPHSLMEEEIIITSTGLDVEVIEDNVPEVYTPRFLSPIPFWLRNSLFFRDTPTLDELQSTPKEELRVFSCFEKNPF